MSRNIEINAGMARAMKKLAGKKGMSITMSWTSANGSKLAPDVTIDDSNRKRLVDNCNAVIKGKKKVQPPREPKYPLIEKYHIRQNAKGYITPAALDEAMPPGTVPRIAFDKAFGIGQTWRIAGGVLCLYPWDVERALAGLPPLD